MGTFWGEYNNWGIIWREKLKSKVNDCCHLGGFKFWWVVVKIVDETEWNAKYWHTWNGQKEVCEEGKVEYCNSIPQKETHLVETFKSNWK